MTHEPETVASTGNQAKRETPDGFRTAARWGGGDTRRGEGAGSMAKGSEGRPAGLCEKERGEGGGSNVLGKGRGNPPPSSTLGGGGAWGFFFE